MFMASAVDFLLIFVSLELVTISFYILVAFMRRQSASLEAGVKYLILGALSTGFFVYGITWIFGLTGETNLAAIAAALHAKSIAQVPLLFGIMLVLVGLGFKIAAAPFQLWVPDVYQGAPTPITAFLSVGSKAAGFIVLLRVLQPFLGVDGVREKIVAALVVMAASASSTETSPPFLRIISSVSSPIPASPTRATSSSPSPASPPPSPPSAHRAPPSPSTWPATSS